MDKKKNIFIIISVVVIVSLLALLLFLNKDNTNNNNDLENPDNVNVQGSTEEVDILTNAVNDIEVLYGLNMDNTFAEDFSYRNFTTDYKVMTEENLIVLTNTMASFNAFHLIPYEEVQDVGEDINNFFGIDVFTSREEVTNFSYVIDEDGYVTSRGLYNEQPFEITWDYYGNPNEKIEDAYITLDLLMDRYRASNTDESEE